MQVYKFGGASVSNASAIKNMANIVSPFNQGKLLIVISAMGNITNELVALTESYIAGNADCHQQLDHIKAYHFDIIHELFGDKGEAIYNDVANAFVEIEWLLEEEAIDAPDYIYDQIVSIGEIVSTKIVCAYLNAIGCAALWMDARNFIKTDNSYKEGQVDWEKTEQAIQKDLPALLEKQLVVTQGFIGSTSENFTTTLGREGSDYSAAIFCSCLNADSLTIWKDVTGVYNADPKWFKETERIPNLSYHDAIELTYYGATVIHPKTLKPLQNKNIPLYVRSFNRPDEPGTDITAMPTPSPIPSFIIEENLSDIFSIFHAHKVKVNTMLNSAISFSVSVDYDKAKITALLADLSASYKVKYNTNLELVTIRYYNQETIERVTVDKEIILEVKSRHTCQMVMKNKALE
jgi:aspartate kinase